MKNFHKILFFIVFYIEFHILLRNVFIFGTKYKVKTISHLYHIFLFTSDAYLTFYLYLISYSFFLQHTPGYVSNFYIKMNKNNNNQGVTVEQETVE